MWWMLFFTVVACILLALFIYDRQQKEHTILRNYPIVGYGRFLCERLGVYFREYFYSMDWEGRPFSRNERGWVYRAAKNLNNTIGFGSVRDLTPVGTITFANAPFAVLNRDSVSVKLLTIGPYSKKPYAAPCFFNISGMSYGALSKNAVLALSHGAKLAGCWMNTGEGGLSEYHLAGGCDIIFQIGTANFGVRDLDGSLDEEKLKEVAAKPQVKMIEVKLSQGAKPGKGGLLPGIKVTPEIAAIRGINVGQDAVSPNRHNEFNTVDGLLDYIHHVRDITGLPTGVKFVLGDPIWLEELCNTIRNRGIENAPDFLTLDSADGGTGAAPMSLMDYTGMVIDESLPALVDALIKHGLRERIKVIVSGKLVTPAGVARALCIGADFINSARGFLFSLGCIQALRCHTNTCPTGITTHDPRRMRGLVPESKATRVAFYAKNMAYEVGTIAHSCGVPEPRELKRRHARIMMDTGKTISLADLYPEPNPIYDANGNKL